MYNLLYIKWSSLADHLKTGPEKGRLKKMVTGPVIACHSITGPFGFWTQMDHSKSGQVWYLDGHCKIIVLPTCAIALVCLSRWSKLIKKASQVFSNNQTLLLN